MKIRYVLGMLVLLGLAVVLTIGSNQAIIEPPMGDINDLADMLGIPVEFRLDLTAAQLMESVLARVPVRDSTGELTLEALNLSAEFKIGNPAALLFETSPGAQCQITIIYERTGRQPESLIEQTKPAGANGRVRWDWRIGTVQPTRAIALVRVSHDGHTVEGRFPFFVTD